MTSVDLSEAAVFLSQVMGLNLSDKDIADLENRTEGWIAGLQLATVSLQGQTDTVGDSSGLSPTATVIFLTI